jgi:hypothetical protein
MVEQHPLLSLYVAFAFISQALLLFNFAALLWKPDLQKKWGWIVYASGLIALPLGVLLLASHLPWYFGFACVLFAGWAFFGYSVDILRPVQWRKPIRWSIFLPYVFLYICAQFAFWIPLWFLWQGYWILYALLYAISTGLNISTHFRAKKTASQETPV